MGAPPLSFLLRKAGEMLYVILKRLWHVVLRFLKGAPRDGLERVIYNAVREGVAFL